MARRARRSNIRTRDFNTSITNLLRSGTYSPSPISLRPPSFLTLYEDRRTWAPPIAVRSARSFDRPTRLNISRTSPARRLAKFPSAGVSFVAPKQVLVCVRRHQRREVLHALHKTGRGGQSQPRWTPWSRVHC